MFLFIISMTLCDSIQTYIVKYFPFKKRKQYNTQIPHPQNDLEVEGSRHTAGFY